MPDDPRVKTVRMLDCHDFNAMIHEQFGRKWNSQQSTCPANNTVRYCQVSPEDYYDPPDYQEMLAKVDSWVESPSAGNWPGREEHETVHMEYEEFLDALCARGVLEPGEIQIHFWW